MASTYLFCCIVAAPWRLTNQRRCLQGNKVLGVLTSAIPCIGPPSIPRGTMQTAIQTSFPSRHMLNKKITYLSCYLVGALWRPNQQMCLQGAKVHRVLTGAILCIAVPSIQCGTMQTAIQPQFPSAQILNKLKQRRRKN